MLEPIIDVLDSGWLRVGVYALVAAHATWWGLREQRWIVERDLDWWPTYWFVSAVMLVTMGVARAGALGDFVGELGREQARASGWYANRRFFQAVAVIGVATVWFTGVLVAIWRVPPRRRRYLPHVIVLSGLIAFAAVRLVSLHHVDVLLYGRDVFGIRIVAIIELGLLTIAPALAIGTSRFEDPI